MLHLYWCGRLGHCTLGTLARISLYYVHDSVGQLGVLLGQHTRRSRSPTTCPQRPVLGVTALGPGAQFLYFDVGPGRPGSGVLHTNMGDLVTTCGAPPPAQMPNMYIGPDRMLAMATMFTRKTWVLNMARLHLNTFFVS